MSAALIKFHADAIRRQTAEMEAAEAAGDMVTAGMLWDAIVFRKQALAKRGVVII